MTRRRAGFSGIGWGIAGSYAWLTLLGVLRPSILVAGLGVVLTAVTFGVSFRLFRELPRRKESWFGLLLVWVTVTNLILVNLLWDWIPREAFGVGTGKGSVAFYGIHGLFFVLTVAGLAKVVRDLRPKSRRS